MSYTVTVSTTTAGAELISAFLFDMGAEGVSIQDKNDLKDLITGKSEVFWDYIDDSLLEADDIVKVTAFYADRPCDKDLRALQSRLDYAVESMPMDMGKLDITLGETTDDDSWYDNWKAFYKPIVVGDVTVVPAWQDASGKITVKINPCMAFGTGEHESTQMCLSLLQSLDVDGRQVIDVGCGSGILGIAALKMGAKHCYFADIDGDAIRNMQENAALNEVSAYIARKASLLSNCPVKADIILANITADILMMLASNVCDYMLPNGALIVSGIIAERSQEVLDAFAAKGLHVVEERALKDWRAYLLKR
jgi:ribosomal protein L11 methyltransferase